MLIIAILLLFLFGAVWAARELFHAKPDLFEVLFGVGAKSFFGPLGWVRKYKDYPTDRRYKNWLLGILPYNDFWHAGWYLSKAAIVLSALVLVTVETPWFDFRGKIWAVFAVVMLVTMAAGGACHWAWRKWYDRKKGKG